MGEPDIDPPTPPAPPRLLRLRLVSDGSHDGTYLLDADTGERIRLDGHVNITVDAGPHGGKARIVAVFPDVPVEVTAAVQTPLRLVGVTAGGRPGTPPAEAMVARSPHAGAMRAGAGSPIPATHLPPGHQQAMDLNRKLNEGRRP